MSTIASATQHDEFQVIRMTGALVAIVTGLDLALGIGAKAFAAIQDLMLRHSVICIRNPRGCSPQQLREFGCKWGDIQHHSFAPQLDGIPGVIQIGGPTPLTSQFHADMTHASSPPGFTMLLAKAVPRFGNDTMFSNMYAVFDSLSPGLQNVLKGQRCEHDMIALTLAGYDEQTLNAFESRKREGTLVDGHAVHPAVIRHPLTGGSVLYINRDYTTNFLDWTREESLSIFNHLFERIEQPKFIYRHHWEVGDVLIWDNRCTQHAVVNDLAVGADRVMERVTIRGCPPQAAI